MPNEASKILNPLQVINIGKYLSENSFQHYPDKQGNNVGTEVADPPEKTGRAGIPHLRNSMP